MRAVKHMFRISETTFACDTVTRRAEKDTLVIARSDSSAVARRAKAEATKQSIPSSRGIGGLLRFARNDEGSDGCGPYCVVTFRVARSTTTFPRFIRSSG